ncbi:MAG: stage III sporulation protein AF [Firmicutes bacterium]|nr:stage III sporulation protein AF [Bacillota bacterium]
MSSISSWILSIAGISVIGVLVELVLPNGQTKKYVKGVFAFVVVMVIITPLPKLLGNDFQVDDIFEEDAIIIQEDFVYQINRDRLEKIEEMIEGDLKDEGLENVQVKINANIFTNEMTIDAVFVDLSNLVITEKGEHKNTNEIIINSILKYVSVEKSDIVID